MNQQTIGVTVGAFSANVQVDRLLALLSNTPIPTPSSVPNVGEVWHGQGGIYVGVMVGDDGARYHLIKATADLPKLKYGGYDTKTDGADSKWDGLANTFALIECSEEHPAAKAAAEYQADGHCDFYLPARRELQLVAAADPAGFDTDGYYWTSTQDGSFTAWALDFEYGSVRGWDKDREFRVRPVRRLPI